MPTENKTSEVESVSWSMDIKLSERINEQLTLSDLHFQSGNFSKCFDSLKVAKFSFLQSLTQEERHQLKQIEDSAVLPILAFKINWQKSEWENNMFVRPDLVLSYRALIKEYGHKLLPLIEAYRELLMDLLNKYGWLTKFQKNKTILGM